MPSPERRKRPPARMGAPADQQQRSVNKKKSSGAQAAQLVADPRFRRRVQRLERLGSRITGELLAQLAAEFGCRPEIERFIDRAVENEEAIRAFGFDRWPPLPMRV